MIRRALRYYNKAEVHVPGEFTSNGRRWNLGDSFQIQYLTHSTHSPQRDLMWDGRVATFVGRPKLATLHLSSENSSGLGWVRVATWKAVSGGLRQLRITKCKSCLRTDHQCAGHCCRMSSNEYFNVGDKMAELSLHTCKNGISLEEVEKTCHGERCYEIERVLPGSYVWFGVATLKGEHKHDVVDEETFLKEWEKDDIYGTYSFVIDINKLLTRYRDQIAKGREVILRCGGTFLYNKEVCYVVIVTYKGDKDHDVLPTITSIGDTSRCNWERLLDDEGCFTGKQNGFPSFMPHHIKGRDHSYWDHVVFAVSLPHGTTLKLDREALCGNAPQETNHTGLCHRFKLFPFNAAELCKEEELLYRLHQYGENEVSCTMECVFTLGVCLKFSATRHCGICTCLNSVGSTHCHQVERNLVEF